MNRQKWIYLILTLALFAGAAGVLARLKAHQKLGNPGLRWRPTDDPVKVQIELPAQVLDYTSEVVPEEPIVVNTLPRDTSFAQRYYSNALGNVIAVNVVLMGTDRTSIHKPQFCLEGGGWHIDSSASQREIVHMERPQPYDLPVMKLIADYSQENNGKNIRLRRIYVYWFVADGEYTTAHWERMWWMARDLVTTGVLQRWAYIAYTTICLPGQEDATFERIKELIAASVPEFQLVPKRISEASNASEAITPGAGARRKDL